MKIVLKAILLIGALGLIPVGIFMYSSNLALGVAKEEARKVLNDPILLSKLTLDKRCLNQQIEHYDYDNFLMGFHQVTFFTNSIDPKCAFTLRAELARNVFNTEKDVTVYALYGEEPLILKRPE